jgi:hypothetical protein
MLMHKQHPSSLSVAARRKRKRWASLWECKMKAIRSVVLGVILIVSSVAQPADSAKTVRGQGLSSSFQMDVPDGWKVNWTAGPSESQEGQRQVRVFDLAPISESAKEQPLSTRSLAISGYYYTNMVPIVARTRWEGPFSGLSTELPRIDALPAWTIVETSSVRTLTAYTQLGSDVLYIHLVAPSDGLYERGKRDLIEMLKSYKENEVARNPRRPTIPCSEPGRIKCVAAGE